MYSKNSKRRKRIVIHIKDVTKGFDKKVLFSKFDLVIKEGDFIVFGGKSGCGKTTLLHMIGALEEPDQGKIEVYGKNIYNRKYQQTYLQKQVGFLFQNFGLIENKTVRQNLELIKKSIRTDLSIEEVLEYVKIPDKIDEKVYKLSGGEQQRVALARLMFKKCNIILADEPTGSLDEENANNVIKYLKRMNEEGKTVIMVSHAEAYRKLGNKYIEIGSI